MNHVCLHVEHCGGQLYEGFEHEKLVPLSCKVMHPNWTSSSECSIIDLLNDVYRCHIELFISSHNES